MAKMMVMIMIFKFKKCESEIMLQCNLNKWTIIKVVAGDQYIVDEEFLVVVNHPNVHNVFIL